MKLNHYFNLAGIVVMLAINSARAQADLNTNAAFVPTNPAALQPLKNKKSPTYRAAKNFQRGVNLGDYLEASGNWGVTVEAKEFVTIKKEGFDHVRVPVGWHRYAGPAPDFTLSPEIFGKVDFVVTNALKNKLAVMINIHHFNAMDKDPAAATEQFVAMWRQIAAHYQNFPLTLAFELDNEPHEKATTELMNPIYARTIAEIRRTNPKRTLVVEPGSWGGIGELSKLVLPSDDNVMVSVHCYEPFFFTHQGAGWVGADFKQTGFLYPGPPAEPLVADLTLNPKNYVLQRIKAYNTLPTAENPSSAKAFAGKLKYVRAWSEYYGRPVHIGEFGAYIKADEQSRANFYAAFRQTAEREKLGWCIWDWSASFRYWDKKKDCALPGMHDALFGKTP
jgi:endoglucanase